MSEILLTSYMYDPQGRGDDGGRERAVRVQRQESGTTIDRRAADKENKEEY